MQKNQNTDSLLPDLPLNIQLEHQPSFIKAGLQYSSTYSSVRSQSFHLKYTVSEILKFNGNALYKSGEYLQASEEYEKSLSIFRHIVKKQKSFKKGADDEIEYFEDNGNSPLEKAKLTAHKLGLYLNLSLCYLIMGRCFNALRASQEALKLEPYNTKALYRSAKAKIMNKDSSFHELMSAKNELELALKQQSTDQLIKQELAKLNEELNKHEEKSASFIKPSQQTEIPKFDKSDNKFEKNEKFDKFQRFEKFEKPEKFENFEKFDNFGKFDKNISQDKKEKKELIPKDVQDLEQFLKSKGQDIIKLYEMVGKFKEADEFKNEMKAALEVKSQIEKIGLIDFERPNEYMREMAEKYNIDLSNPSLKNELLRIQNHNLKELRQWMDSLQEIDTDSILKNSKANIGSEKNIDKERTMGKGIERSNNFEQNLQKQYDDKTFESNFERRMDKAYENNMGNDFEKKLEKNNFGNFEKTPMEIPSHFSKTDNSGVGPNGNNNYFINNNFYSPLNNNNNQYVNNYGPMSEEKLMKWIECQKCKDKKGGKHDHDEEEGEISGVISCLNCALWGFSILFIILTIVFQIF